MLQFDVVVTGSILAVDRQEAMNLVNDHAQSFLTKAVVTVFPGRDVFQRSTQPETFHMYCQALRMTKVEQGKEALRPTDDSRCCLGVACDLAIMMGAPGDIKWVNDQVWYAVRKSGDTLQEEQSMYLPEEVQRYLGIKERDPIIMAFDHEVKDRDLHSISHFDSERGHHVLTVSTLNDDDMPFPIIADLLDQAYL